MPKVTLFDLTILAIAFWGVWSLRFTGVENIGFWSMGVGVIGAWIRRD